MLRAEPLPATAGARAFKTVRELFGVPLAEVRGRLRALAAEGERGTGPETALLAARLREGGFAVTLEAGQPPTGEKRFVPTAPGRRRPANPAARGRPVLTAAAARVGRGRGREVRLVPGSLPEELREPLADYLAAGRILVIAASRAPDPPAEGALRVRPPRAGHRRYLDVGPGLGAVGAPARVRAARGVRAPCVGQGLRAASRRDRLASGRTAAAERTPPPWRPHSPSPAPSSVPPPVRTSPRSSS
ncbi:hypothetical protein OG539_35960 [Actinacidiphila glaucinigra]|uniref:hypothetical protein n=1 Tax=Actinacidiphila glaucinigra TaxID=235986 RepID=UPI00324B705C